jgi:hypothetical protein
VSHFGTAARPIKQKSDAVLAPNLDWWPLLPASFRKKTPPGRKVLKMSPAITAGVSQTLWSMDDLCEKMDAVATKAGPRGPYKTKAVA